MSYIKNLHPPQLVATRPERRVKKARQQQRQQQHLRAPSSFSMRAVPISVDPEMIKLAASGGTSSFRMMNDCPEASLFFFGSKFEELLKMFFPLFSATLLLQGQIH